jgi:enoyl-CoA hydratase/carnithine racemase
MSEQADLLFDVRGRAAWLTINRPDQRNALNGPVIERLLQGLERAGADPVVRCVVLTGAGDRAFCAGADLTSTMAPSTIGGARSRMCLWPWPVIRCPLSLG